MTPSARADVAAIVNALRTRDCPSHVAKPLHRRAELDAAARYVGGGDKLSAALTKADYRMERAGVLNVAGQLAEPALKAALHDVYCGQITDPALTEFGVHMSKANAWIVLATPFKALLPGDMRQVSQRVLALVNDARAKGRRCGAKRFAPTHALALDPALLPPALAHSRDMAKRGDASHDGSDGSAPAERVTRAGYQWRAVAENVASGQTSADEVVQGWLQSPHHCVNIMDPSYSRMAVAYAVNENVQQRVFWTQLFAQPR